MATEKEPKKTRSEMTLENLEKSFGKNVIHKASSVPARKVISSGYDELNAITGCGGIPMGVIVELYGPEASGKGVLSMHIMAEAQKQGLKCLWVDAECQVNSEWMAKNGIDVSELDILDIAESGMTAEDIIQAMIDFADKKNYDIFVVDSLAAMQPKCNVDRNIGDPQVGRMGAILSDGLRKLAPICSKRGATVIFINQIREKIGIMFGSPETTPGGRAVKHWASLRMQVFKGKGSKIERRGAQIGQKATVKIIKSRFGMPFLTAEIPIYYEPYEMSPIEVFLEEAYALRAITKYKGNFKFGKIVAETLDELMEIIIEAEVLTDVVKKMRDKSVEKGMEFTTEAVIAIVKAVDDGTFELKNFKGDASFDLAVIDNENETEDEEENESDE